MPTLAETVAGTMFFTASHPDDVFSSRDARFVATAPSVREGTVPEDAAIWSWQSDPNELNIVRDVRCRARGMDYQDATVCTRIEWKDDLRVKFRGRDYSLHFSQDFLLKRALLRRGRISASASGLWQLAANIDQSLLVVFGYELRPDGQVRPVSADINSSTFMPGSRPVVPTEREADNQGRATVNLVPRLIVCLELICCKERADFEPMGALGVARFYPHLMVMPSVPLESVHAVTSVYRPFNTAGHCHALRDEEGAMASTLSMGLFADANSDRQTGLVRIASDLSPPSGPLVPLWSNIFDYYNLSPSNNSVVVVDPHKGERTISSAIGIIQDPSQATLRWADLLASLAPILRPARAISETLLDVLPLLPSSYRQVDIIKVERQGAYDNVHLSPRMSLDLPLHHEFDIVMAPICAHDCLHMHWRWGRIFANASNPTSVKHLAGWDLEMNPYRVVGSPLVPHNQKIAFQRHRVVGLHEVLGFDYVCDIDGSIHGGQLGPGKWQVVFHHGGAYAVSVHFPRLRAMLGDMGASLPIPRTENVALNWLPPWLWARIYFMLQNRLWGAPRMHFFDLARARDG